MHLKKLTVHGFKSFADRTEFEFRPGGFTCIVGPNGCGKSNVVDAIKWILGEQRPTSLRGKEMTDVIFNGTVRRPPMGLCEGTLTFDNTSKTLPLEEPEVTVSRRVFRTGETEYLINGRPSRLKDLRDLFAGTGLGVGGYAFMEQGKIDRVLAGNPVERRSVFEEAAGISRFRARKHETELKLQKVVENLTRLADVIEEVGRSVRSLKIHAGKARNYREMSDRMRTLQVRFSRHRYAVLNAERRQIEFELSKLQADRLSKISRRDARRDEMKGVEVCLSELVESVAKARTSYADVSGRITNAKEKIEFQSRYASELDQRLAQRKADIDDSSERLTQTREDEVIVSREREALDRDLARGATVRAQEEEQVQLVRSRGEEIESSRRLAEGQLRALEQEHSEWSRQEARIEAEIQHAESRRMRSKAASEEADARREERKVYLETRSGSQDEQTSALEERRQALCEEELRSDELEKAFADALDDVRKLESELGRVQARRDVLQGLKKRRDGLDEGTRTLLELKAKSREFLPGFQGLLLDLFDVDLAEARAVEAALGDVAHAIVVSSVDDALAGLAELRRLGRGGALFLPLDRFEDVELRPLSGVRPSSEAIARVLSALLFGLEIVDRNEFEARLQVGAASTPILVSAEGELLRDGRVLTCQRGGEAGQGLVVLQAELNGLERKLPDLLVKRNTLRSVADSAREARDHSRARVRELSVALVKQEGDAARLDQEIVRLVRELETLDARREELAAEVRASDAQLAAAQEKLLSVRSSRAATSDSMTQRTRELEVHRERAQEFREELDRALSAFNLARVEEAKTRERLEGKVQRFESLRAAVADLERRLVSAEREIGEIERGKAATTQTLDDERQRLSGLEEERQQTSAELEERERAADQVRDELRHVAEKLDELETELAIVGEGLQSVRGREGETRAALESLKQHAHSELALDLEAEVLLEPEAAMPGGPLAETDGEADLAPAAATPEPSQEDWKQVEAEIKDLRERIVRLGNVNLAAVEELEEAEKRQAFILREKDDLEQGQEQLRRVLKSIEVQSTQLFLDTFNAVKEHFSVIFRKLFGGGKADIILENVEAPLESGIEIKARPPGKELRSITLLSGGERSMTAVALLFAIFKAHPAPCAFMDEVDAALDEDNTERFVRMVSESREQAQFLVVTHSKRTMEHADLLYGVTMPERGVSRRVAVRLEQLDDHGQIRDLDAVNRQAAREAAVEVLIEDAQEARPFVPDHLPPELAEPRSAALEAPAMARRARPKSKAKKPASADQPAESGGDGEGGGAAEALA